MSRQSAEWSEALRVGGLRRFATTITLFNVLGHSLLGFEQSWAQPVAALLTTYLVELLLESVAARAFSRRPRFRGGGLPRLADFLVSAHITGLAVSMLLYANDRVMPIALASGAAVASKYLFRINVEGTSRHFLNPSNFGIALVLLAFPWVGIAPPYHFTENLEGAGNWILPAVVILSGTFLNTRFTHRMPLILSWVSFFVLQALIRSVLFDASLAASLMPMTGFAFILFTFYMVTDPATTPRATGRQVLFGGGVALVYALLVMAHVVFGLFFALVIVCAVRGGILAVVRLAHVRPRVPLSLRRVGATAAEGSRS